MYEELKAIQKLLWENDDIMDQDTLYMIQNRMAILTKEVAEKENKCDDLINSFPFLYNRRNKK